MKLNNKKILLLVAICLLFVGKGYSQYKQDVVYLKNGTVIRGVIIEQIPNVSLKIETVAKNIFAFKMEEIAKMTKEDAVNSYNKNKETPKSSFELVVGPSIISTTGTEGGVLVGFTGVSFDFFKKSEFKLGPELDILIGGGVVAFFPGVKLGHDNIFAVFSIAEKIFYYGIGGSIPTDKFGAIDIGVQFGNHKRTIERLNYNPSRYSNGRYIKSSSNYTTSLESNTIVYITLGYAFKF